MRPSPAAILSVIFSLGAYPSWCQSLEDLQGRYHNDVMPSISAAKTDRAQLVPAAQKLIDWLKDTQTSEEAFERLESEEFAAREALASAFDQGIRAAAQDCFDKRDPRYGREILGLIASAQRHTIETKADDLVHELYSRCARFRLSVLAKAISFYQERGRTLKMTSRMIGDTILEPEEDQFGLWTGETAPLYSAGLRVEGDTSPCRVNGVGQPTTFNVPMARISIPETTSDKPSAHVVFGFRTTVEHLFFKCKDFAYSTPAPNFNTYAYANEERFIEEHGFAFDADAGWMPGASPVFLSLSREDERPLNGMTITASTTMVLYHEPLPPPDWFEP